MKPDSVPLDMYTQRSGALPVAPWMRVTSGPFTLFTRIFRVITKRFELVPSGVTRLPVA